MTTPAPIAVALDTSDLSVAARLAGATAPHVSTMKVGLQLFSSEGPGAVEKVRAQAPGVQIMLDLKLHDIPATVTGAARSLARLHPEILTVHALGGTAMIAGAADALPGTVIAAVTILTSLHGGDLDRLGIAGPPGSAVRRLAAIAVAAGARALVCSPLEVAAVRDEVGPAIRLITPGIRPAGSAVGDQARLATPVAARAAGSDLLVIGRPIIAADDPGRVAADIAAEVSAES